MNSQRMRFLNVLIAVCLVLMMFPISVAAAPSEYQVVFTKTVDKADAKVGDIVTFTITANSGPAETDSIKVTVTDNNTPNAQYLEVIPGSVSGGTYNAGTDTISWTGTLFPGGTLPHIITFQAQVKGNPPTGGILVTNTASVTDVGSLPGSLPLVTASASLTIVPSNGLIVFTKAVDKALVGKNDVLTFTLRFRLAAFANKPTTVHMVDVNPAPAYLQIDANSVTGGGIFDLAANRVIWDGTLTPGSQEVVVSFQAAVTSCAVGSIGSVGSLPLHVTNVATLTDANGSLPGSLPQYVAEAGFGIKPCAFPYVYFDPSTYEVNEGAGTATVTVHLSAASAQQVTVNYATSDGTATAGSDYTATSGTLTFAAGETMKTFDVPIIDDATVETNETINLALSDPVNAVLAPVGTIGSLPTAVITIVDNDAAPTTVVGFNPAAYTVQEKDGSVTLTVVLDAPSAQTITVDYATQDNTAVAAWGDYTAASGTLTFAPGETSKTISITVKDESFPEAAEMFKVNLSNPTNAVLDTAATPTLPATATVTILDAATGPNGVVVFLPIIPKTSTLK